MRKVLTVLCALVSLIMGASLGAVIAETVNTKNTEPFTEFKEALPTRVLDIHGELITELVADEKREIISLGQLPLLMIDALITREDRVFYEHRGFSAKAVFRAVVGQITKKSMGGGSTLTQQIAGTLYCDRSDYTIKRKIKELWYAVQMERRCSKNEILETYLNKIYFGGGTYGVNAASKYYFGHGSNSLTPAEAALLVIQLSNPAYYNPFEHPNRAMERQRDVLNSMAESGYITREAADVSFNNYWDNFDYTRTSAGAYITRDDKAPWFSEYVRRELLSMIYGSMDIYTGGFVVNTTLDLEQQYAAQDIIKRYTERANRIWQREKVARKSSSFRTYTSVAELAALLFGLDSVKLSSVRSKKKAEDAFVADINPVVDLCSMIFGIDDLKTDIISMGNDASKNRDERTTIEGTMVAIQNDTGYITALIGGSEYSNDNQLIRAVQSRLQPGSTFKPLYYSAAIDSRRLTAASIISDTPVAFQKEDGTPYVPQNFRGEWQGDVQLWYALAHSMNVPSLKVLDNVGFEAAIERTSSLLGIPNGELEERHFIPVYPFGLGVCAVRPIELCRAYSVFASGGREVTPIAIRTVEDRNGNIILNPELEVRKASLSRGKPQVISAATAYVMVKLLENTVQSGTLASQRGCLTYRTENGRYTIPLAGKTGTTQNWADAWTAAISPYYTSVFWFGFDKPGNSLGLNITGATLAGPAMGEFMSQAHKGLAYKDFDKPGSGVSRAEVCTESGLLPVEDCPKKVLYFLSGTEPDKVCNIHSGENNTAVFIDRLEHEQYRSGEDPLSGMDAMPLTIDWSMLDVEDSASKDSFEGERAGNASFPYSDSVQSTPSSLDGGMEDGAAEDESLDDATGKKRPKRNKKKSKALRKDEAEDDDANPFME